MTDKIFPGLGQPKCQLFFDLQSMIAKYGGRQELAKLLEIEQPKIYKPNYYWSNKETLYLLAHYNSKSFRQISIDLNKTFEAVKNKVRKLRERCMLDYKNNVINNERN